MSEKALVLRIENHSEKHLLLKAKDRNLCEMDRLIQAQTFKIFDPYLHHCYDMNEIFFQFQFEKEEINPKDIGKHHIKVEFFNEKGEHVCYDFIPADPPATIGASTNVPSDKSENG